jgi:DNA polymerase III alpha subunit
MINVGDVDIDFADRKRALALLEHIPASIIRNNKLEKHNTGVYFHAVPIDPISSQASLHYETAEQQGCYKIDLLNVGIYEMIKDEHHLLSLMNQDINWQIFQYPEFNSQLIHLGNHADLVASLKPQSISDIAMILALIRPGKKHLIDHCKKHGFESIANDIWTDPQDGSYVFKKSHSFSYAMLVKVHAGLIIEQSA